jgi:hypothetical protein
MSSTDSAPPSAADDSRSSTSSEKTEKFRTDLIALVEASRRFRATHGVNIFDNYAYREYLVVDALDAAGFGPVRKLPGRSGFDAISAALGNVEIKTINAPKMTPGVLSRGFQFDKQNDPERRAATGNMDALALALFVDDRLRAISLVHEPEGMTALRALLRERQDAFEEKMAACRAANKRLPRDSISISMRDLAERGVMHDVLATTNLGFLMLIRRLLHYF